VTTSTKKKGVLEKHHIRSLTAVDKKYKLSLYAATNVMLHVEYFSVDRSKRSEVELQHYITVVYNEILWSSLGLGVAGCHY